MISAALIAAHFLTERGWTEQEIAAGLGASVEQVREWIATPLPEN